MKGLNRAFKVMRHSPVILGEPSISYGQFLHGEKLKMIASVAQTSRVLAERR